MEKQQEGPMHALECKKNRGREPLLLLVLQEGGFLSLKPCESEVGGSEFWSNIWLNVLYVSAS